MVTITGQNLSGATKSGIQWDRGGGRGPIAGYRHHDRHQGTGRCCDGPQIPIHDELSRPMELVTLTG
jgi:hypothetical protein